MMWFWVLIGVLCVGMAILLVRFVKDDAWGFGDYFMIGVLTLFLGFVVGLLMAAFSGCPDMVYRPIQTVPLVALKDSTGSEFVVGSGALDGSMQCYYSVIEDGVHRIKRVPDSKVSVKEANEPPTLTTYQGFYTGWFVKQIYGDSAGDCTYTFTIPIGSTYRQFNVDLK